MSYDEFLTSKLQYGDDSGFDPVWMPDFLFDFQRSLVEWAVRKGRAAIFADCGLGKTPMQLVWAQNVIEHTSGRVLVVTPLAVGHQTIREAEKFGVDAKRSTDGTAAPSITITNYERLEKFDPGDYAGVVCDESSAIKSFDGKRRAIVTEFLRRMPYRLLCTATAAPNDYIELGTSSEALGELGHMDMLNRFFKNDQNTSKPTLYLHRGANHEKIRERAAWRFKGHAEEPFWRWVASWARALRRPSDLGFSDARFKLPPLQHREHVVEAIMPQDGRLFDLPALGIREEREESRRTIRERCEQTAELLSDAESAVAWCYLNDEGDLLTRMIDGAQQVKGSDSVEHKEEVLSAFGEGKLSRLVTKPKIGAWGLNWQHCHRMSFFPSHSYEQYYQAVRRSWRFGQKHPVTIDIVTTEGGARALANLERKAQQADRMFTALVAHMQDVLRIQPGREFGEEVEVPPWLSTTR